MADDMESTRGDVRTMRRDRESRPVPKTSKLTIRWVMDTMSH